MAGMTAKHKKNGVTFTYTGDLRKCIEKAEKELKEKENSTEWLFLKWQYEKAERAYNTFNRRVNDLKEFIEIAKKELAKQEAGNDEREDHNGSM